MLVIIAMIRDPLPPCPEYSNCVPFPRTGWIRWQVFTLSALPSLDTLLLHRNELGEIGKRLTARMIQGFIVVRRRNHTTSLNVALSTTSGLVQTSPC